MKTNFLKSLKHTMFLFIVVVATSVGYSQSNQNPSIGGSRTPSTGGLIDIGGKSTDGGLLDIGGRNIPSTGGIVFSTVTQCIFSSRSEIGGRGTGSDTGQFDNDNTENNLKSVSPFASSDIGGRDSSGGLLDIGGRGDTGTGANPLSDIGGRGTGGDTGVGQISVCDIGGRSTGGEITFEIGGRSQEPPLLTNVEYISRVSTLGVYS